MKQRREKVTKEELFRLCRARREALLDLANHLRKTNGSEILAKRYEHQIIRGLEREIADKMELWLGVEKSARTKSPAPA